MGNRDAPIPGRTDAARQPHGGAGVAGSVALHVLLLLALILAVPKPAPPPPKERRIAVEILDAGRFEEIAGSFASNLPPPRLPAAPALPATPPDIVSFPADLPLPPRSGETIVPERLLSAAALADPRSARALAALPRMAADDRIVQLCTVEALAQVAALDARYAPDLLSAYSMEEVRLSATSIEADGAAFRSQGRWYGLAFTCTLTPALDAVAGFEFTIGEEIPHEQWASHDLVEGSDPHGH